MFELSLLLVSDISLHSVPVVHWPVPCGAEVGTQRRAPPLENQLQTLSRVLHQRPVEEKAKTLTLQTVIFLLLSPLAAATGACSCNVVRTVHHFFKMILLEKKITFYLENKIVTTADCVFEFVFVE